jgi:hypothetical protein
LLAAGGALAADVAKPAAGDSLATGWHIVRPGETMEQIASRYLGSSELWQRVARLNPEIPDPNRLEPGQRLRIFLPQREAARIAQLSHKVEAQPAPIPWEDAHLDDLLLERDGVRTHQKSSAEMAFPDGTRLMVTEDSLVYLQRTGGALHGIEHKTVEIVEGQADVEARRIPGRPAPPPAEVEIVLGTARATAHTNPQGTVQTRARRAEAGGAKVMAYGGDTDLEAGGAKVQVPQGMGSSVAASGPPTPPEKLLAAPAALAPADGAEVACANPAFSWEPVPEAAAYVVEVCRDPGCGALVDRGAGLAETLWRPSALPAASSPASEVFYWRVTARSRSGLDGYPGTARKVVITSAKADALLPVGTVSLVGPQVRLGTTLFAGPGVHLDVAASDEGSGVAGWKPVINGKVADPSAMTRPWAAGVYATGAEVVDLCGNRGLLAPIAFTVDTTPPTLTLDVIPYDTFSGHGQRTRGKQRGGPVTWSGGVQWLALAGGQEVRIESDAPQAFFHAVGAHLQLDGREITLGEGQMLRLRATDGESSVDHLRFHLRADSGRSVLEVEAGDLVGNLRKVEWELRLP